jgi:hypothetical protein
MLLLRRFASQATAVATCALLLSSTLHYVRAVEPEISFVIHKSIESNSEGPDSDRTYFVAAGKRIAFGVPKGCQISGGDSLLLLLNDLGLDGEVNVKRSSFTPDVDLAQNAIKFREAAEQGLPREATEVEALAPVMNPFPFNGWKSLGFAWSYSAFGHSQVRSVSYINLEVGVQIVVTTISAKGDAAKVEKIARQFLASWWVMGDRSKG